MLYLSVPPALILLVLAHVAARRPPHRTRWAVFFGPGPVLAFGTVCIGLALPPVILLFLGLTAALLAWPLVRRRMPRFLPLSAVATLVAFGRPAWPALVAQVEYARLRARYPYESMEDRAPAPRPDDRPDPLPDPVARRLAEVEQAIEVDGWKHNRAQYLRVLHEETVALFVNSPGFGVGRLRMPRPSEQVLEPEPRDDPPTQPASPPPPGPYREGTNRVPAADAEGLAGLHADGTLDFVNPDGFGFVKDRRHVAGFLSHGFSRVPSSSRTWAVRRVELVGLLRHPGPVVYVSARLPAMDDLKGAPTRPPDEFEAAGLAAVRRGEDVYAARVGDGVRMVGAIRSAKQCVECHGGARGDLLGAFSYALGPEP